MATAIYLEHYLDSEYTHVFMGHKRAVKSYKVQGKLLLAARRAASGVN